MAPIIQPNNSNTINNPVGRFMVAVGAIIEHRQTHNILILKRSALLDWQKDQWEIPYGRLAQFEEPLHGLLRELKEETGLQDVTIGQTLRVWHIFRGTTKAENELVGITYHCLSASDTVTLSPEHAEFKWVTPDEALELVTVTGIRKDISAFHRYVSAE